MKKEKKSEKKCWWVSVTRWNILKTEKEKYLKIKAGMSDGDPIILYQASLDEGRIEIHKIVTLGEVMKLNRPKDEYYIKIPKENELANPVHLHDLTKKMPNFFSSNPVHNLSKEKRKIVFETIIEKNPNVEEKNEEIKKIKNLIMGL